MYFVTKFQSFWNLILQRDPKEFIHIWIYVFSFFKFSDRPRTKSQKRERGRGPGVCFSSDAGRETESNRLSSRQYRDKYLGGPTPRNTRNDLRSGAWCFDGGQPEVNLRFTRQYRLLLAPPRALPRVPRGTARARASHNSHNKSPRTTDARSTYKGITDQKEDRRVRARRRRRRRREGRARNNGSTQIAKPPLLRKALLLHLAARGRPRIPMDAPANLWSGLFAEIIHREMFKSPTDLHGPRVVTIRFRNWRARVFQQLGPSDPFEIGLWARISSRESRWGTKRGGDGKGNRGYNLLTPRSITANDVAIPLSRMSRIFSGISYIVSRRDRPASRTPSSASSCPASRIACIGPHARGHRPR